MVATTESALVAVCVYIRDHGLQSGDRLPPESTLAVALGLGLANVREGLGLLELLGVVSRCRGAGTVLQKLHPKQLEARFSALLSTVLRNLGLRSGTKPRLACLRLAYEKAKKAQRLLHEEIEVARELLR